jgi:hypothetical protein
MQLTSLSTVQPSPLHEFAFASLYPKTAQHSAISLARQPEFHFASLLFFFCYSRSLYYRLPIAPTILDRLLEPVWNYRPQRH